MHVPEAATLREEDALLPGQRRRRHRRIRSIVGAKIAPGPQARDGDAQQHEAHRGGKSEAGLYEFWTIFKVENGIVIKCTARCHHGSDPGERFRRMEGERGYEDCWEVASTAKAVRPARPKEVTDWLNGHREDTAFAESCLVGDKMVKLVETADGFRFE